MADISTKVPQNTTLQEVADNIAEQNAILQVLAASSALTDFAATQRAVRAGAASKFFDVGDQIVVNWTDSVAGKTYEWPFEVVHFGDVELEDGEVVPGMFLQAHYCSPFGVMFDQSEAIYYCEEALPAGTYYFTIGTSWGTYCVSGTSYYFTTTVDIPAGGQIRIGVASENGQWAAPDTDPANWRVWTYESPAATSSLEGAALALTEGTEGTALGTATSSIKYDASVINNLQRAGYGYNRWSQSAIRQYLNSDAAIGSWWEPQNNFDRAPAQLGTYPGFLSGFEEDFLNILKPVKVTTALNSLSDTEIGTQEDTYDTFFLASLEQQYITPQLAGVEGSYFEYWKRATGAQETIERQMTGAFPLTYAINALTSPQAVRLRSANRSDACSAWAVYASGGVGNNAATYAWRFAPVCVVC